MLSCGNNKNGSTKQSDELIVDVTKLEILLLLSEDSIVEHYDLSNDNITEFPDLSSFSIKSLNLSKNQLDTFIICYLPKGIEKLNLSFNLLKDTLYVEKEIPTLIELNLSNNSLTGFFSLKSPIKKLNLSHNNLANIRFWFYDSCKPHRAEYVDISHNTQLSSAVGMPVDYIDTIVYDNIGDDNPISEADPPPPPPQQIHIKEEWIFDEDDTIQ